MTPFMLRVAEIVGTPEDRLPDVDELAPMPETRVSRRIATGTGADRQVAIRSLAEQLVSEANAILGHADDRLDLVVGGGTGLAPLKSMVRHALENDAYAGHLTLYQGGRTREWLYDVDTFRALAAEHPDRFTYRPCLSEETEAECGGDAAAYGFGMVTDVIAADHASLSGATGYLCGPPPMVEAALKTLMSKRLFPRDIHREDFFNEGDKESGAVRSPLIKR